MCAVLTSYAPALRDGFVWDDTALVLRDPLIRSWRLIPEGFNHFLFIDATASDFYRPLQRLTYTLEYCAVGFRPMVFHLTSILCHLGAALAFFLLANELLRLFAVDDRVRRLAAFFAALVWAVHPVQSAAVIYISGRADPLAALFGFLGLAAGLQLLRRRGARAWWTAAAIAIAFLLSALSKEMGLIFPALWLLILWQRRDWLAVRNAAGITVFVFVVYLSLRLPAEHIPPPPPSTTTPTLVRPIIVARAVAEYAGLLILPVNLHMDREVETRPTGLNSASISAASWRELQTLLGLALIAVGLWAIVKSRHSPALFVCLLLALVSYLPISGFVALNASVSEHWLYLPSAFLLLAVCLTTTRFALARPRRIRLVVGTAAICWIVFLAARTFMRTFDWRDSRTFLERTIADGGNSSRMLINLAGLDLAEKKFPEARALLQKALTKDPDQGFALLNLAAVAMAQNDFVLARECLERARKNPLMEPRALELLAVLEIKTTGSVDLRRFRLAARTGPPDWPIEKRYVAALRESGQRDRAITELKLCLATQWYRAETWELLSELYREAGRADEAAATHEHARLYDVHLGAAGL